MSLDSRFWDKVNKNGPVVDPELGPCWLWTAATNQYGYGIYRHEGRVVAAHRLVAEQKYGRLDRATDVDHQCHTPACVNPGHLRKATRSENSAYRNTTTSARRDMRNVYRTEKGRYQVKVKKGYQSHYFGTFDTLPEAQSVAEAARKELFGKYAGGN